MGLDRGALRPHCHNVASVHDLEFRPQLEATVMVTRAAQEDLIARAWTEVDAEAYEYTRCRHGAQTRCHTPDS